MLDGIARSGGEGGRGRSRHDTYNLYSTDRKWLEIVPPGGILKRAASDDDRPGHGVFENKRELSGDLPVWRRSEEGAASRSHSVALLQETLRNEWRDR